MNIFLLILSTFSYAGISANQAAKLANIVNHTEKDYAPVYHEIKQAAKKGRFIVTFTESCAGLEFLSADGYRLLSQGCSPVTPYTCLCAVTWGPIVN